MHANAEDVYRLFGKLFLPSRVEYDFTNRRDSLAGTDVEQTRQNHFDFDRVFRRGFCSAVNIKEIIGNVKNILGLWILGGALGCASRADRLDLRYDSKFCGSCSCA